VKRRKGSDSLHFRKKVLGWSAFPGQVTSSVPGYPAWLNIRYDSDDASDSDAGLSMRYTNHGIRATILARVCFSATDITAVTGQACLLITVLTKSILLIFSLKYTKHKKFGTTDKIHM
jgi:hypothetical protein